MMQKKRGLSREQAAELYKDLQTSVAALKMKQLMKPEQRGSGSRQRTSKKNEPEMSPQSKEEFAKSIAQSIRQSLGSSTDESAPRGHYVAVACIMFFAFMKVVFSGLEASGVASVQPAEASVAMIAPVAVPGQQFSKEELTILTSLDHRRVELEDKSKRLDDRESELSKRDAEYVSRLAQLRELTEMLRSDREKNEKKRNTQLDQLANVYGSMDPREAATLIEQLDVTIALALLERMPEKRIGQILSLMNAEKALKITKMLSGKAA